MYFGVNSMGFITQSRAASTRNDLGIEVSWGIEALQLWLAYHIVD